MDNVIAFNAFAPTAANQKEVSCWLCQRGTSIRALFCPHCGSIQPVRPLDHFTRLGLERRIDIDLALLERQYQGLRKSLDPQRFAIRGLGERRHAARQLEALDEAYHTLYEPLRRGRYWLELHEKEIGDSQAMNPMVSELYAELDRTAQAQQCDRIAQKAGQALEQGIVGLMQALRAQNWSLANSILLEVDGLESLLDDVRVRRAAIKPEAIVARDDVTPIK